MAIIGTRNGRARLDHPHKLFVWSTWRGILRVSGWPRARGKPKDAFMQSLADRMRETVASLRKQHPREVIPMMEAVNLHNATTGGLRGSARVRLRDVQYKIASGTMFALVDQFGHIYWPTPIREMVSEGLDWTDPSPGSMLVRHNNLWLPTAPCTVGSIFTALATGAKTGTCGDAHFKNLDPTTEAKLTNQERAVQEALSVIGQTAGDIMFRGPVYWQALPVGQVGQVLAIGSDLLPHWFFIADIPVA